MGSDLTCVNSARVSFDKESFWEINPDEETGVSLKEKDQKLISYLAKHNHWTPFSHVQITMREKVPIFVARQRFKSVVGFSYNEVSRRYVDDTPEFYTPQVWRSKAENKKQGSSDTEVENSLGVNIGYVELVEQVIAQYEWMLTQGVAPELARMILP
jgi:thymidylate synthase (FAD)